MEVFGEEGAQFFAVLRPAAEEVFTGGHKFLVGFVVFVVEDFLFEKFPQPFNQVQIRRVARQKMKLNVRFFQILLHQL